MTNLTSRVDGFGESIIRKMTRIAIEYDSINLAQGFPDFPPPSKLIDELIRVATDGPHQYEITWGSQLFREKLAIKQQKYMGIDIDPNKNIVVTCGSTEAMMAAVMSVCNQGDKVIVFSPFYENYAADTILCGATPIYVPLNPPKFSFDVNVLKDAVNSGAKAIILCNPSNPTGKVFTLEELTAISDIVKDSDCYVITDEVYEHIVYEPHVHTYFASLPKMKERTISCGSLSKTYSITGWRLGYIIGPKEIIDNCKKVHDFLTVGAAAPLQRAAVAGLTLPDEYYRSLLDTYTHKRDLFLNGLQEIGLKFYEPQGAYYVLIDISEFGYSNDHDFCIWLAKEIGVAAVPGSSFFKEDIQSYIRLHFAKKDDTLLAALGRLKKLKDYIKN